MPFESYHEFVDLSKRKPYVCRVCLRDIKHPFHQPVLAGTEYVPELRLEMQEDTPQRPAVVEDRQLTMF